MGFDHHYREPKSMDGVPELDPGTAGAAMALLVGSVLAVSERRRRRPST
jgi:hypothetical protein